MVSSKFMTHANIDSIDNMIAGSDWGQFNKLVFNEDSQLTLIKDSNDSEREGCF